MIALGQVLDGVVSYMPDDLIITSSEALAREYWPSNYEGPWTENPAWGYTDDSGEPETTKTRERSRYSITQSLSPEEYDGLIRAVALISATFGVVQYGDPRRYSESSEPAARLLNDLVPYLVYLEQDFAWPGTVSVSAVWHPCFRVTDETIKMIVDVTSSLWDWSHPELPEDVHFLREDGTVVLGSTRCDEYAWLELDDEELQTITEKLPPSIQLKREETPEPTIARFQDSLIGYEWIYGSH